MRVFNVRCDQEQADGLTRLVAAHRQAENTWRERERKAIIALRLPAAERSRRLAALRAEVHRRREAGEFLSTRTAAVLPALYALLAEWGWDHRRFRPIPADALRHGRPWGTHDKGWEARVTLHLPDDLAERLQRACYWASAPAVGKLQTWYDQFGDHWRGQLHAERPVYAAGPSTADLSERSALVARIHTTGSVLRQAIDRTLTEP